MQGRLLAFAILSGLLASSPAGAAFQAGADPAVLACIPPALRNLPTSRVSVAQRRTVIACLQRHAARQINDQTPIPMGDDMLVSAIAADTTLHYNIRLGVTAAEFGTAERRLLAQRTRSNVCASADMRRTLSMGGAYAYNWYDRGQRLLLQERIDRCP